MKAPSKGLDDNVSMQPQTETTHIYHLAKHIMECYRTADPYGDETKK